jgi:hypothetical protein
MSTAQHIPDQFYFQKLQEWHDVSSRLRELKEYEAELRRALFSAFFIQPREGTNDYPLNGGWTLQGNYVLNRTIRDEDELQLALKKSKIAAAVKKKLLIASISISLTTYRELPEDKRLILDTALEIKPGMPSLTLVPPQPTA